MKRIGFWLVGTALYFIATSAVAKEVVIVTSFPRNCSRPTRKPSKRNIRVSQSSSTASKPTPVSLICAKPRPNRKRISFGSARRMLFRHSTPTDCWRNTRRRKEIMARIPAKIGNFPIHDPDGKYFGFAISGYGLMWNKNYLKAHKLPAPKEWTDLTHAEILQSSGHQRAVAQRHDPFDR